MPCRNIASKESGDYCKKLNQNNVITNGWKSFFKTDGVENPRSKHREDEQKLPIKMDRDPEDF